MAYMFGNVDEDDALATPVDASVTTESTQLRQGAIVVFGGSACLLPWLAPVAVFGMMASGAPVRVQFDLGSYDETITGTVSTQYLLWASAGQTFTTTLSANTTALASLYAPDGVALYQELSAGYTAKVTLPTNGDYRLEIRSGGRYTAGVMIR